MFFFSKPLPPPTPEVRVLDKDVKLGGKDGGWIVKTFNDFLGSTGEVQERKRLEHKQGFSLCGIPSPMRFPWMELG